MAIRKERGPGKRGVSPGHWTLAKLYQIFLKEMAENSQVIREAEKLGKMLSNVRG